MDERLKISLGIIINQRVAANQKIWRQPFYYVFFRLEKCYFPTDILFISRDKMADFSAL